VFQSSTDGEGVWMAGRDMQPGSENDEATEFRLLSRSDWRWARDARLAALSDSPDLLLPAEQHESSWSAEQWLRSCETGLWAIARSDHTTVGLARLTRDPDMPHIESVWTHPGRRRERIASRLISLLVGEVPERDVFVWVIRPNPAAFELYESLGFKRTKEVQTLDRIGRIEERLRLSGAPHRR
jgi:ribosomal protein S18 acetylase RimI-like enzyme